MLLKKAGYDEYIYTYIYLTMGHNRPPGQTLNIPALGNNIT